MNAIKKNKKLKFTLLLTTLPQRYGHIKGVPEMEFSENYSVIRFYTPEHGNKFFKQIIAYIYFMIGALKYAYFNRKYFDSIFATSSRLGTGFLGFVISKITRKNLFLDIRDIFSDNLQSLPSFQNPLGKFIVKIFAKTESRIINHAKWVNFVSPGFKLYPHIAKMTRKFYLFTNGIDDVFLKDSAKRVFQKKNSIKRLKILYAGNIGYGQGLEFVIIPIALHFKQKIQIQLIGDGSSIHIMKKKIKENKIKNIELIAPVERTKLIKHYNDTDIFLLQLNDISAFERVLPSKIFDYGSYKKPIIAGVKGVAKDFMKSHLPQTFFYEPKNIDPVIKHIDTIFKKGLPFIENKNFIKKFSRTKIMDLMLESLIEKNKTFCR